MHNATLAELAAALRGAALFQRRAHAALPRADRALRRAAQRLHHRDGRAGAGARPRAADARLARGDARAADRRADRAQGHLLHRGRQDHLRLARCSTTSSRPTTPPSSSGSTRPARCMLGKTNMDEFAMGSSNETSYYGPVRNPWDTAACPAAPRAARRRRSPRGSRPAATGTDTGGSIRQPAALTGITGLKPTYGRVSRYGMIAFASSLDQGGPLAAHRRGRALLLEAMAGFDARDSTSARRAGADDYVAEPRRSRSTGLQDRRAEGILRRGPRRRSGRARSRRRSPELEKLGREAVEIALPNTAAVGAGLLRGRPGRGLLEPVALRRRALRPPRARTRGPRRPVQAHARRGLRRRGQAPHPDRHLRAVRRLLRRLLPQGAAGAAADRAATSRSAFSSRLIVGPTTPRPRLRARRESRTIRSRCT